MIIKRSMSDTASAQKLALYKYGTVFHLDHVFL